MIDLEPKRILIIKTSAIGDVLMATPMLRALRKRFPQAEISWLVGKWSSQALRGNPHLDCIVEFDDEIIFKKRIFKLIDLLSRLRDNRYDLTINLHRSLFMATFVSMMRAKIKLGYRRFFNDINVQLCNKHETLEYLDLANAIDIQDCGLKLDIFPSAYDVEAARFFLVEGKEGFPAGLKVGIAPGGAQNPGEDMPSRRWHVENYAIICKELQNKYGAIPVLLGGSGDREIADMLINEIVSPYIDLVGKTSILQVAAIIGMLDLLICNDSGLMHIGGAMEVPIVAIFGPTDPLEKIPFNDSTRYLWARCDCSPCYKDGKYPHCKTYKCLKAISPDDVLIAAEEIISRLKQTENTDFLGSVKEAMK